MGNASLHCDETAGFFIVSVAMEAKHLRKGDGEQALRLLPKEAFQARGLDAAADNFLPEQAGAERLYQKAGFRRVNHDLVVIHRLDWQNAI